ncbi:MAG: Wzz/FepE/Etk N-terminal domain-containing protein [Anaerolineae bacterium]
MSNENDLNKLVRLIQRYWKWLVSLSVAGAGIALVIGLVSPPRYEATAWVVVTQPRYQLQFETRIQSVNEPPQTNKALPELALTDAVLSKVIEQLGERLNADDRVLAKFKDRLSARAGADPTLIRLTVAGTDPQETQAIANTWLATYVAYVNDLYQQSASDEAFFTAQATEAQAKLAAAEQALVDYQGRNSLSIITAQLASRQAALTTALSNGRTIAAVIQDARSLQQQLARQQPNSSTALADELAALYLQVDALNAQTTVPIQLQIGGGSAPLATRTASEQAALLGTLIEVLTAKAADIAEQAKAAEPELLALQQQQQAAQVEGERLTRERDLARDTYVALAHKLDEVRVGARDDSGLMQQASPAALPTEPAGPRKLVLMILGGTLGLLAGGAAAYFRELSTDTTDAAGPAGLQATPEEPVAVSNNGRHEETGQAAVKKEP